MNNKRITLLDLANELGLSKTTVSRAINNFPEVNQATKTRVKETAEKLGYFADRSAIRLAKGVVGAVGLIVDANADSFMDPILAEFIDGVGREFAEVGTDLVIQPVSSTDPIAAYKRAIAQNSVDCFIVISPTEEDPRVAYLAQTGFPFVLHGRTKIADEYCFFNINNEAGFYDATRVLLNYDHQKIGFLGGFEDQTFTIDRLNGTKRALSENGLKLDEQDIHLGPMTEQTGYKVGLQYFAENSAPRPSAFLCLSLFVALGFIRAAREHGKTMPDDFSLIVHDDRAPYLKAEYFDPPLTALQSSIRRAGREVAKMCAERIENPTSNTKQIVQNVELHERASVGPRN